MSLFVCLWFFVFFILFLKRELLLGYKELSLKHIVQLLSCSTGLLSICNSLYSQWRLKVLSNFPRLRDILEKEHWTRTSLQPMLSTVCFAQRNCEQRYLLYGLSCPVSAPPRISLYIQLLRHMTKST